ncbi:MAG: transporter substrate-binding domain-containing protein [Deltaproteobacteria bacterium]|nr:transporter substrate-binding domain-containing protein [Deltaproteobacteria bacterium]
MRSCFFIVILSSALFSCVLPGQAGERISLATLDWAPYAGKDLPNLGFTSEIVTRAFEHAGYRVDIAFMPWARVLRRVARGDADAMYPAYRSTERARVFALSDPFAQSFLVFYKRVDDDIAYTGLRNLEGYRIGVVRGYVNSPAFDQAEYLLKESTDSDESNLRKLLKGRIDLAVIDLYTARHLLENRIPKGLVHLEPLEPPLEVKTLHLAVSRRLPGYRAVVADFNRALSRLSSDGTLEEIKTRQGIHAP